MSLKGIRRHLVRGLVLLGVGAAVSIAAGCASVKPEAGAAAGGGADAGSRGGAGGSTIPVMHPDGGMPPGCGNGQRTRDEACDDGNNMSGDGCSADCLVV